MKSENLTGGNSNQVRREVNTVVRQCGKWSPFVHQLLRFLTEKGFTASPRFIETDGHTERLSYIEGRVGNDPLHPSILTDEVLIEAAQLLRQFHDVTQDFVVPDNAEFLLSIDPDAPYEVICHNDFAPYNCVYRDGHIVGIIDFDTASPNTRVWDVAYAVYRFVPLMTDAHCIEMGWTMPPDRAHRLHLFCDAYGSDKFDSLIETVIQRIQALIDYMHNTNSNLDHIPFYLDDIDYIQSNREILETALQ